MRLALFQADHRLRRAEEALTDLEAAMDHAAQAQADLLLTPELYLCGYGDADHTTASAQPLDGPVLDRVRSLARDYGVGVVFTYPEHRADQCFNSATVIDQKGAIIDTYRKQNLANDYERGCFEADNRLVTFTCADIRCSVLICYDVEFPEMVRAAALQDVELVLVPTALSEKWRFAATHLVPTRAYENGIFVAYCNFSGTVDTRELCGLSVVAGPDGRDVARADKGPTVLIAEIYRDAIRDVRSQLHFLRDLHFEH